MTDHFKKGLLIYVEREEWERDVGILRKSVSKRRKFVFYKRDFSFHTNVSEGYDCWKVVKAPLHGLGSTFKSDTTWRLQQSKTQASRRSII